MADASVFSGGAFPSLPGSLTTAAAASVAQSVHSSHTPTCTRANLGLQYRPIVSGWAPAIGLRRSRGVLASDGRIGRRERAMAGGSRRRRRRRERPPDLAAPAEAPASVGIREAVVAEEPSKRTCDVLGSTSSLSLGSDAWENLLDGLLHQIITLISSFHDFLAFSGTCRSWHAAASTFPSVYTFTFPPLHLEPEISHGIISSNPKWKLVTPAKRALSLRCSAPRITSHRIRYLGCSFGYLIFSDQEHCHLVDVYTGTTVKPPKLQFNGNSMIYYGILVAPLSSPNSQLVLFSRTSMLQWQVGTDSWTEHPFVGELILQIVLFKGQMFAIDFVQRLHVIRLAPQFSIQEVAVMWEDDMLVGLHSKPWLVVCGDMLVLVDLSVSMDQLFGFPGTFRVFRLDFSDEPAKWVKIDLENWALFLANDRRTPTFSCMNPESWGGKSNSIYVPTASEELHETWTAIEVGQPVPSSTHRMSFSSAATAHFSPLHSLWVLPSLVYGIRQ